MKIKFQKYSGTGNDFIVIDNRNKILTSNIPELVKKVCLRKISVGADGVLLLENSSIADFKMRIFNSDGSEAEMCGNGARCIAMFAYKNGIINQKMNFETLAGIVYAEIIDEKNVKIKLSEPKDYKSEVNIKLKNNRIIKASFINTGVPHTVIIHNQKNFFSMDITNIGREIRYHKIFQPAGTNVNFVKKEKDKNYIRTYERGVEDETLACGTGSTATAIILAIKYNLKSPVSLITKSGEQLRIHFNNEKIKEMRNSKFDSETKFEAYLEGPVNLIYTAEMEI
ncbi:MAG TPA: diaminopimelate epimerase [bacterium]|nr:diaminopimelate epimerase [bacterium]HOL47692.1 diaminopimelate epimerase [bacterium]HPQ19262.1 diaminopimelate epimerase [bacterium]